MTGTRLAAAREQLRALDRPLHAAAAHRLDARVLLLSTLLFVAVVLSFDRMSVSALLPLALFPLVLASRSGVAWARLGQAVLLATPLVLLAGAFEPWLQPRPALQMGGLSISAGWLVLTSLLLRVALTVSATLALVAGCGLRELCAALRALGVPALFTDQLLFMHRYAFVLVDEGARIATAWRLRAGGRRHLPLATWGPLAGQWLLRSLQRAQRVHQAMLARGWRGAMPLPLQTQWQATDTRWLLGWALYFAAARSFDLPQVLGRWATGA